MDLAGWFRDTLADFEIDVSRLTLLFLSPAMPILALSLPVAVAAKEFVIVSQSRRTQCDLILTVLSLISLVIAWRALGVPMWNLTSGLQG